MKEVRAFLELTALSLLPALVLLIALTRRSPAMPEASAPLPLRPAVSVPSEHPRMAAVASGEREVAAPKPDAASAAAAQQEAEAISLTAAPLSGDAAVTLTVLVGDSAVEMNLRDYLIGVVAAEMPASFEAEALMAQAVAARTDTLYRMQVSRPHRDADCCADPGCCKAYASPEELRGRWGEGYDKWAAKIASAVDETDGEILTYGGEPIFAAFHASSAGSTECSENVWLSALPYLRSVPTGETEQDVPRFRETVAFTPEELAARLTARCPGAEFSDAPEAWLTDAEWSESGRLLHLTAGGVSLSGNSLRSILGLRSAAVTWTVSETGFTFETLGYGHGVGMSQYGAEAMAKDGFRHRDILLHYYSGAAMADWTEVFRA